ncbi:MAG TPA: hypothetical protein VK178_14290 [Opitutaceae bacterium]|nr:hypothetical protein [Opitutaceae bacterium]
MVRSPTSSAHLARRLRGAALLALVAAQAIPLGATPPAVRLPILNRLGQALFPSNDPGYLPSVGAPGLRLREVPATIPIKAPPVALYAVPAPAATTPDAKTNEPNTEAKPNVPDTPKSIVLTDRPPPPVRPEDFLPYFQLNDGSSRGAPAEGVQFTPARPELPSSQAEYRQQ